MLDNSTQNSTQRSGMGSINAAQKNILDSILCYEFQAIWHCGNGVESAESGLDGIKDPIMALKAFDLMLTDREVGQSVVEDLERVGALGAINQIRKILSHESPQNGVPHETHDGTVCTDSKPGLLGLTKFNNDQAPHVTKHAVVKYIATEIGKRAHHIIFNVLFEDRPMVMSYQDFVAQVEAFEPDVRKKITEFQIDACYLFVAKGLLTVDQLKGYANSNAFQFGTMQDASGPDILDIICSNYIEFLTLVKAGFTIEQILSNNLFVIFDLIKNCNTVAKLVEQQHLSPNAAIQWANSQGIRTFDRFMQFYSILEMIKITTMSEFLNYAINHAEFFNKICDNMENVLNITMLNIPTAELYKLYKNNPDFFIELIQNPKSERSTKMLINKVCEGESLSDDNPVNSAITVLEKKEGNWQDSKTLTFLKLLSGEIKMNQLYKAWLENEQVFNLFSVANLVISNPDLSKIEVYNNDILTHVFKVYMVNSYMDLIANAISEIKSKSGVEAYVPTALDSFATMAANLDTSSEIRIQLKSVYNIFQPYLSNDKMKDLLQRLSSQQNLSPLRALGGNATEISTLLQQGVVKFEIILSQAFGGQGALEAYIADIQQQSRGC